MATPFTFIQCLTIVIAATTFQVFSLQESVVLVWSIAFSHYLLALVYSRQQIISVLSSSGNYIAVGLIIFTGFTLYQTGFSLVYLFGLHHALNESYIGTRFQSKTLPEKRRSWMQGCCFITHLIGFLLMAHTREMKSDSTLLTAMLILLCLFCFTYLLLAWRSKKDFSSAGLLDMTFAEIALLVLVGIDLLYYDIHLYQIVFYHLVFWVFFPANNMYQRKKISSLGLYLLISAITIGVFVYYSPVVTHSWNTGFQTYYEQFKIWSYVHIMMSFAVSSANPQWINRQFDKSSTLRA